MRWREPAGSSILRALCRFASLMLKLIVGALLMLGSIACGDTDSSPGATPRLLTAVEQPSTAPDGWTLVAAGDIDGDEWTLETRTEEGEACTRLSRTGHDAHDGCSRIGPEGDIAEVSRYEVVEGTGYGFALGRAAPEITHLEVHQDGYEPFTVPVVGQGFVWFVDDPFAEGYLNAFAGERIMSANYQLAGPD